MKLSILDQSPVMDGKSAAEALKASVKLAQNGEKLGYTRYWIAEHHGMEQLASSVPEVMLTLIAAKTNSIKIGSGAILLPHYKPYKIAETFNMLATLFPDRIDLGIGRAPGGSAEASIALSGNFLENVKKFPEKVTQLFHFLYDDFPKNHFYSTTRALPKPINPPQPWILGTSSKSAVLAAELGTAYAFAHFMSEQDGMDVVHSYKNMFTVNKNLKKPYCIVTVNAICAKTSERAEDLALLYCLKTVIQVREEKLDLSTKNLKKVIQSLTTEENNKIKETRSKMVVGNPIDVKKQLSKIKYEYDADEIMIVTITNDYRSRLKSYELIANISF
ncbi:LLM class flavin-dependent oxidoreductase [Aquibacillus rhizosphaerae]|uniref:LLM class flavin-dependent oxidoreductase n=1 Tax=Aquibacillus rhizosphaerae TaxID=3051431 RepID=A0ABT7L1B7_9BACI|nr:LLM class flavin-dependent oxidoreductase [Aquibacillus sp. LR5S19]MDL4839582.1 LLM class flavin-dependent oxidoreductase [Aquibacillus sp. LR5S19]